MKRLIVQILTQNSEKYLEKCLKSLQDLSCDIIIYDLESKDRSVEIGRRFGEVYEAPKTLDRSRIQNFIQKQHNAVWHLMLHPWESLTNTQQIIDALDSSQDYFHLLILQGEIITKEVRLWKGERTFKNYAFEMIYAQEPSLLNCLIYSAGYPNMADNIAAWTKDQPCALEPIYYQAFDCLSSGQTDRFISLANHYLFMETKPIISSLVMKYYLAAVYLTIKNDIGLAIKHILEALCLKPLMAEYWCLLGDAYYRLKEYKKSKQFYNNAIILGRHRPLGDAWPIETRKYKDYPNELIASCDKIMNNLFGSSYPSSMR